MHRPLPTPARRALSCFALTCLAGATLPAPLLALQANPTGRVRWSVSDEFELWSPDDVALGDFGSAVFAGLRTNTPGLRMFAAGHPVPLFDALPQVGTYLYEVKCDVAEFAPLAASISTHHVDAPPQQADILAIVRAFDPAGDGTPLWERHLPLSGENTEPGVAISDDGGVVFTWWSVEDMGGLLLTAYDRQGAVISQTVIEHVNGTLFPDGVELSHDGSTAMLSLQLRHELVIYDVHAGGQLARVPNNGTFCGSALSGDGRRFARSYWASYDEIRLDLFELVDGQPPALLESWSFTEDFRASELALDYDGSRLAYAVQEVNPTDTCRVVLYDQHAGANLFQHTFSAPGTTRPNWCVGLELDDLGETLAGVSWGDSLDQTPEVFAFDDGGKLLVAVHARGSGMHLDLSRDGELLFAGCRGAHATVFGNGGDLYMIETRAQSLRLEGEPRIGAELDLAVRAGSENDRMLLVATSGLLPFPASELRLDPSSSRRLVGVYPLSAGQLDETVQLPTSYEQAGETEHYQGILLDDQGPGARVLTNKVSVRYLP